MDKWESLKEKVTSYLVEANKQCAMYQARKHDFHYQAWFGRVVAYTKVLQDMLVEEETGGAFEEKEREGGGK